MSKQAKRGSRGAKTASNGNDDLESIFDDETPLFASSEDDEGGDAKNTSTYSTPVTAGKAQKKAKPSPKAKAKEKAAAKGTKRKLEFDAAKKSKQQKLSSVQLEPIAPPAKKQQRRKEPAEGSRRSSRKATPVKKFNPSPANTKKQPRKRVRKEDSDSDKEEAKKQSEDEEGEDDDEDRESKGDVSPPTMVVGGIPIRQPTILSPGKKLESEEVRRKLLLAEQEKLGEYFAKIDETPLGEETPLSTKWIRQPRYQRPRGDQRPQRTYLVPAPSPTKRRISSAIQARYNEYKEDIEAKGMEAISLEEFANTQEQQEGLDLDMIFSP